MLPYSIFILVHWLVISRCILFYNSCSLLCDSKTGVTSNPFPPLSRPRLAKVTPIKMQNMLYNI
nr:MAG TPA: hypothetical protein [Microviridae sp.]